MADKKGAYDRVGGEIISFLPYLLVIPVAIYGNIKLYRKHKSAMFVRKRKLLLLFGLNISLLIGILASLNFHAGNYYLGRINGINPIIYFSSFWLILFFLITKNWSIYFQYKWQYYSLQISWQQLINKKTADTQIESNWFMRNKNRWGKVSFFQKRFAILATLSSLSWPLTGFSKLFTIFGLGSILIIAVLYIVIVCKTPYYKDVFYIHYESKIHAKLLLIAVLIVIAILMMVMNVDEESIGQRDGFFAGIIHPFTSIMFGIMIYISTFVIMKKNLNSNAQNLSNTHSINVAEMEQYNSELILSHKRGINLFIQHLAKEYSMECLLSYIEFCQYQKYLIENDVNDVIKEETKDSINLIDFPENIPLSEIIEDDYKERVENEDDYKLYQYKVKAHKIFKKYVEVDAEFEINVSWILRRECADLVSNLDALLKIGVSMNDLVLLFEDCKKEMKMLLDLSLLRFKKTEEFEDVIQIFDETDIPSTDSLHQHIEIPIVLKSTTKAPTKYKL